MNRLPSLFLSHGAPLFALEPGVAGPALRALGRTLPRPRAIAMVSAHWMALTPRVSTAPAPATIHDFGGFPAELYRLQYPAPGHPELARRTVALLRAAGLPAQEDPDHGLDHGAWVPLMHLYPEADVPVFQVTLPARLDGASAWAYGRALAPLADEGVLIVGSGSLTHNLNEFFGQAHGPDQPYVVAFTDWVRDAVAQADWARLRDTLTRAPQARRAHPTPEHFWPLIVAAGAGADERPGRLVDGGIEYGMLSMDAFVFGGDAR